MIEQPFARLFTDNLVGQVLLHLNANLVTVEFSYSGARHTYELSFETDQDAEESFRRLGQDEITEMVAAFVHEVDQNNLADLLQPDAVSA